MKYILSLFLILIFSSNLFSDEINKKNPFEKMKEDRIYNINNKIKEYEKIKSCYNDSKSGKEFYDCEISEKEKFKNL